MGNHFVGHIVRQFIDIVPFPLDRYIHRRDHVHTDFQDIGYPGCVRQCLGKLINSTRYFYHRAVNIRSILELQLRERIVLGAHGIDIFYVGDRSECILHGLADLQLDLLRAGSRIRRDDQHIGEADLRQKVHRDAHDRDETQDYNGYDRYKDGKWPFNTEFFHYALPSFCTLFSSSNENRRSFWSASSLLKFSSPKRSSTQRR